MNKQKASIFKAIEIWEFIFTAVCYPDQIVWVKQLKITEDQIWSYWKMYSVTKVHKEKRTWIGLHAYISDTMAR